jgi:hypothetical protein
VDGDGVLGFLEENAVIADAEAEQTFELTAKRLHTASAGLGVAMNGFQNIQSGPLFDLPDLDRDVRLKADLFHAASIRLVFADLIQG